MFLKSTLVLASIHITFLLSLLLCFPGNHLKVMQKALLSPRKHRKEKDNGFTLSLFLGDFSHLPSHFLSNEDLRVSEPLHLECETLGN